MPSGTPKYFKQIETYSDRITPDDPEFEAKMRELVGKANQDTINKDAAANVDDPTHRHDLYGFNTKPNTREEALDMYDYKGLPALLDQGKHAFGVGAGASPGVFAHEFRHDNINDETSNRKEDLLNSPSYPAYVHNLTMLYNDIGKDKDIRQRVYSALGDNISPATLPLRKMEEELLPGLDIHLNYDPPAGSPLDRKEFTGFHYSHSNLNNHIAINRGEYEPGLLDKGLDKVGMGDLVKDYGPYKQTVPRDLIKERDYYPGLHFVGTVSDGDKSSKEIAAEQDDAKHTAKLAELMTELKTRLETNQKPKNKKASGGAIELPNDYRKGGRTRMI